MKLRQEFHFAYLDVTFVPVEHQAKLSGYLHEFVQVDIMLTVVSAEYEDVVCYSDGPWTLFQNHVQSFLEDILRDPNGERQLFETVSCLLES